MALPMSGRIGRAVRNLQPKGYTMPTAMIQTRSAIDPNDQRSESQRWTNDKPTHIAIDAPGITIYLTREQAIQMATALLTGFMQSIPDVTYNNG